MMMKAPWVLQVCHSYYPPFLDCARQYSSLFKHSDYKVLTVYLTGEADAEVAQKTASDEVIFLGYKSRQVSGLKLKAIARLKKIVAARSFVFCIAHRAKPTYVALLATDLPVISIHHNFGDFSRFSRRLLVNLFKGRLFLLGVSNAVRDEMRLSLSNWPESKIKTLYNHINVDNVQLSFLSRDDARQSLGLPKDAWIIGNVGRLHYDKDQATLIRGFAKAIADLPTDSLLVIMGSGDLESSLKQLVKSLDIEVRVKFTGQVIDGYQYFKAFDIFALTSDREPFGMVLLEAMAANIPVICSDCGGGAEVIRDVGTLFPFGNVAQLAQCMKEMSVGVSKYSSKNTLEVLKRDFSDEAARLKFWSFDFIQECTRKYLIDNPT